jgi:hypothetical protein
MRSDIPGASAKKGRRHARNSLLAGLTVGTAFAVVYHLLPALPGSVLEVANRYILPLEERGWKADTLDRATDVLVTLTDVSVACVPALVVLMLVVIRSRQPVPACGKCGRSLAGVMGPRCPECGRVSSLSASRRFHLNVRSIACFRVWAACLLAGVAVYLLYGYSGIRGWLMTRLYEPHLLDDYAVRLFWYRIAVLVETPAYAAIVAASLGVQGLFVPTQAEIAPYCPHCGYCLRGLTGPPCPSCGHQSPIGVNGGESSVVSRQR